MGFTYVAFEGYEVIAQAGDETIDPRRNLPKAMIYSVLIVTVIYILVAFASLVSVKTGSPGVEGIPWEWIGSFKERGFGEAVSRLMPYGNFFLTLAVIFASISALNATIFSATRASYALGRDRMLPGWMARISQKCRTPWAALMATGVIIIGVAVLLPTMDVASSASIMFLFLFFLVNLSVIKIRLNMGDELSYGFLMPFFPWMPLLAIICQAILAVWLIHMSLIAWIVAPLWVLSGIAVYHLYSKSHAVSTKDEIHVLEEEEVEAPPDGRHRVLVAVANPKNALEMTRTTYYLSDVKNATVNLLHMVPVPEQVPLTDAERFMMEGKEGIVEAMLSLVLKFPLTITIRYCRNVARGIMGAVKEKKIDTLIMGWHGRSHSYGYRLGSTVDVILERAPCNVVILKGLGNQKFPRILVPWAGGQNGAFALEMASVLAERDDSQILAFTVNEDGSKVDLSSAAEMYKSRRISFNRIKAKQVQAPHVVRAILDEAKNHDLVILGSTREPLIKQLTRDSVSHAVAQRCPKPLIIVKAKAGLRSWVKRWL